MGDILCPWHGQRNLDCVLVFVLVSSMANTNTYGSSGSPASCMVALRDRLEGVLRRAKVSSDMANKIVALIFSPI
jgi:hypothetical protein